MELAFAAKYSPKDSPSAAVVCALLTDSIVTGDEIDPEFAATGDMTATGEVRPIGGLTGKIRGAIKRKCQLLGAPKLNEQSINDIYMSEGPQPLCQIQIFTLSPPEPGTTATPTTSSQPLLKTPEAATDWCPVSESKSALC